MLIGIVSALAACGNAAAPASTGAAPTPTPQSTTTKALRRMTIGYSAISAQYMPLFVAVQEGFLKRQGLDVRLRLLRGSATEPAALVSGSIQFGVSDANAALAAIGKGARLVMLASDLNSYGLEVWANPKITSVAGLKGKRLGLSEPGSLTDSAARQLLAKFGLSPSAVHFDFLGSAPVRVATLLAGRVDAVMVGEPQGLRAKEKGFRRIYNLGKLPHVTNGLLATQAFVQHHPGLVSAFLKGYVQAIAYAKDRAHKAQVLKVMGKYTQIKNVQLLNAAYNYYVPLWSPNPTIPASDLALSVKWVAQHNHVTVHAAQVVDLKPLQAVEKSLGA